MPVGFDRIDVAMICSELKQCRRNSSRGCPGGLSFMRFKADRAVFLQNKGRHL